MQTQNILKNYLRRNDLVNTIERQEVLKEIYSKKKVFDAHDIYTRMANKNFPISRASIYNHIKLVLKIGLITEHKTIAKTKYYVTTFIEKEKDYKLNNIDILIKHICNLNICEINALCDFLGITSNTEKLQCPVCYNLDVRIIDNRCNKCGYEF